MTSTGERTPAVTVDTPSTWWSLVRRYPWVSAAVILSVVFVAVFAPFLTTHDPFRPSLYERFEPPSTRFLLGSDSLGRDVLTRVFYGARTTMTVAGLTLLIGGGAGLVLGLMAGYLGGPFDGVTSRLMDIFLAFPVIFFGLLFAVSLGPGLGTVVASLSLPMWARVARVVRAEALTMKEREFVQSAKIAGASNLRITVRHILPNVLASFIVLMSINLGGVVIAEAALSFLGAGVPLPNVSWGSMITEGQRVMAKAWWISVFPGMAITLSVLAINLFGDWLRDFLDPTLRQRV